jgi:hypothetical protein
MIFYFTLYLLPGLIWAGYLEYYTTHYLEGEYAKDWVWVERLFHSFLWPISLVIFIIAFIREINNNK